MRKSIFVLILLAVVLMAVTAVSFAQDDSDPGHYHYNFCLNGTWFCPDANDAAREEWNWGAAWYWGLYKAGDIPYSQIPEWARLHADSDGDGVSDDADLCPNQGGNVDANGCPIPVVPPPTAGCYDTKPGYADFQYFAPLGQPGNVHFFNTSDGTCGGSAYFTTAMWLQTALTNSADVLALCNTIGSGFSYARNMMTFYIPVPTVPADIWICF